MPLGGRHQVTKDMGQISYGSGRKKMSVTGDINESLPNSVETR